ncbi:MAG: glycosyltransferase family 4 protein [Deltaproteobacteria bacterium]|nr:glycosyltransferase family 4 protein [Deltaproteobacteria bacterium]
MKVLMFGWEFPPFISGGLGTACYGITQGLRSRDVDVTFVVPRKVGKTEKNAIRLIEAFDEPTDNDGPIRIHPVDSFLMPYMTEESYGETLREVRESESSKDTWVHYGPDLYEEVFRYAVIARSIAKREDVDIIHVHDWMTVPAGIAAREVSGKPLIIHIHALESDRSVLRLNERIYAIERLGMLEADRIITVSFYTKGKIVTQYGIPEDKIDVVHNALSREESKKRFPLKRKRKRRQVLFLGRITSQKGPQYFLEAAEIVHRVKPDIDFVVAGTGDMVRYMKEESSHKGLSGNIHFTGFLNGGEVEQAYASSEIYVMPSVSEPFGITALDAIMYDVPVILSKKSGICEVMTKCPCIDYWDVEKLAKTIILLLDDENLRWQIVSQCKEEIKALTWKIAADKIIGVYKAVIPK